MKKRAILILLILTLSIYSLNIDMQITAEENSCRPTSLGLTPHPPIVIFNDHGLEFFPGSGTEVDPYVIEGFRITTTADSGIYIDGTTKYFTVRNCYVDARKYGINIDEVADGTAVVINNTFSTIDGIGIVLSSSSNSIVANNTCSNNNIGINLPSSSNSIVANNTCSNNNIGINLWSDYCVVSYNLLQENEGYGIYLGSEADNNIIHHNSFVDNNLGGYSQAIDNGQRNKWYDPKVKEGNHWSNLGDECTYKIDGSAHSKDLFPLNRELSCPNPITVTILSIVLPLLASAAILAFVVPKYGVPYLRKRKAERRLRMAKLLSCPNCGEEVKKSSKSCEKCGETHLRSKIMMLSDKRLNTKLVINIFLLVATISFFVASIFGWMYGIFFLSHGLSVGLFIFLAILCVCLYIGLPSLFHRYITPSIKAVNKEKKRRRVEEMLENE